MINAFLGIGIVTSIIYGLFIDRRLIVIYLSILIPYYVITQLILPNKRLNTIRKKLTIATWGHPSEPQAFVMHEVDITKTLKHIEKLNDGNGAKVTITHAVTKALAIFFSVPGAEGFRGHIRFGNFHPSKTTDITILVDVEGGKDLAAVKINDCDKLSIKEIAQKCSEKVTRAKNKEDRAHNKRTGMMSILPTFVMGPLTEIAGYLGQNVNISIPALGITKNSFGVAVITNVGGLKLKNVLAPLTPFLNVPLLLAVGVVYRGVKVIDEKIEIRDLVNMNFTLDHRYGDAGAGIKAFSKFIQYIEDPENYNQEPKKTA